MILRHWLEYDEKIKEIYRKLGLDIPEYIDYEVESEPEFYSMLLC